jgi:pimeloyl-ACP methyl ester carboxylesterase
MTGVLGYRRFGAQGGDWGNAITIALAREFPDSVAGIHLNATGAVAPPANPTDQERAWQQTAASYRTQEMDYLNEQQHKPGTVAFALYDNPVGTAAWIVERVQSVERFGR